MSKTKPRGPVMRWPWCGTCEAHCRETDGVRHICVERVREQLVFAFTLITFGAAMAAEGARE